MEYYQKQGVVPEGEWDAFMAVLRTQLPTTFRINGLRKFAQDLRDKLETDFLRTFSEGAVKVWLGTTRNSALHVKRGTSDHAREPFQARSWGVSKASAHSGAVWQMLCAPPCQGTWQLCLPQDSSRQVLDSWSMLSAVRLHATLSV